MAKDFKAGQIKTSKIIGKGTEKTVFLRHADSPLGEGVHSVDEGGTDVSFVFAGTPDDKVGGVQGVTLFNGDIVVSGTLYAEKQVVDLVTNTDSGITISGRTGVTGVGDTAIHINGEDEGAIVWDEGAAKIEAGGLSGGRLDLYGSDSIRLHTEQGKNIFINHNSKKDMSFIVSTQYSPGAFMVENQETSGIGEVVLFHWQTSGVVGGTKRTSGNALGTDVCFHVDVSPTAVRDTAVIEGNLVVSGSLTDGAGVPVGTGTMSSFTIDGSISSLSTISDGDSIQFLGQNGIETESAGGGKIWSRIDIAGLSTLSPATADVADLLIVQDTSTGNTRKVAIGDLPSSGGGTLTTKGDLEVFTTSQTRLSIGGDGDVLTADSLAASGLAWAPGGGGGSPGGGAGALQINNGSGGFAAGTHIWNDTTTLKTTFGTDHLAGAGPARLNIASRYSDPSNGPTVYIEQETAVGKDPNPALIIIGDPEPGVSTVDINSKTDINIVKITNGHPGSPKIAKIQLVTDNLTIKNDVLDGSVALVGELNSSVPYYPTGDYDLIRSTKGSANVPTVTILTHAPTLPTSVINSDDVNFYVYGEPGNLGIVGGGGKKASAQFGGDVKVEGCVARGGILHLSNGSGPPQSYDIPATPLNGIVPGSVGTGGYTTTLNPAWVQSVIWNTPLIVDPDFYTISGYPTTDITITKAGTYKISYSVNLSQIQPATNRINMRTFLRNKTGSASVLDTIDCSEAWSYGRGVGSADTVSKMTNVCTTTAILAVGDVINLNMLFLHGTRETVVEVKVRASQTWILIERIA